MSTEIKKHQPFIDVPKAAGLQEHIDPILTNKIVEQTDKRNNGLQNLNSIEDPPWYRSPTQEFQKGKRGKNFSCIHCTNILDHQTQPSIQTSKQKYNGLQDIDEIFPKNINPSNKNKNAITRADSDIAKTTETTEAKNEDLEKPQDLSNKIDLQKPIHRQTLNGVPVASSRLNSAKSQTQKEKKVDTPDSSKGEVSRSESKASVLSKCSQQEKKVETSNSCKGEVSRNESQTSVLSKSSKQEKNIKTSRNESQTSVLSKCSKQDKNVKTSNSNKSVISRNESQTSVLSKCSKQEKVEASDSHKDKTSPDKSCNQENLKMSINNPKDQKKKNAVKKPLKKK